MSDREEPTNLEQLLDRIGEAAEAGERVSLDAVLHLVGDRSFGVLLLAAGLITLAPLLGDIPGMPTLMGVFVGLIAVQLLLRREHFWLPRWLLRRSVDPDKLRKALKWMRPPARFIDRLLRPRLTILTRSAAVHVIAAVCILVAAVMPMMEVVPFSANVAGGVFAAFGLSMIARDGLLALLALAIVAAAGGVALYALL